MGMRHASSTIAKSLIRQSFVLYVTNDHFFLKCACAWLTDSLEARVLRGTRMNLESILDCQERGARARILGAYQSENPYTQANNFPYQDIEQAVLGEAWNFGWSVEDCMRQIGTGIYNSLRNQTALAAEKLIDA